MADTTNVLVVMLCINIMLVLGGVFSVEADADNEASMLTSLFTFVDDEEVSDISASLKNETEDIGSEGTITTGDLLGFTDIPGALLNFFKFLLISVTAPDAAGF